MSLPDSFFRELTADEQLEFRKWARANYQPGTEVDVCWHPIVRDECRVMNAEHHANRRFKDARYIVNGACNPVVVVDTLQKHIAAMSKLGCGHLTITNDPAIRLIVHQLGHLCRTYEFDIGASGDEYRACYEAVEAVANSPGVVNIPQPNVG